MVGLLTGGHLWLADRIGCVNIPADTHGMIQKFCLEDKGEYAIVLFDIPPPNTCLIPLQQMSPAPFLSPQWKQVKDLNAQIKRDDEDRAAKTRLRDDRDECD